MRYISLVLISLISNAIFSQKQPLNHTVYDSWESVGERIVSNNGRYVAYAIIPQEGDANMILQQADGNKIVEIPRGYNIRFTDDSKFLIFKIKATYKQTRDAKIKKAKPDEMPKDSLGIIDLQTQKIEKIARVKNYKLSEKNNNWLAYSLEKPLAEVQQQKKELDSLSRIKSIAKIIDSLTREADSLRNKLAQVQTAGIEVLNTKPITVAAKPEVLNLEEGTDLIVKEFSTGKSHTYKSGNDYLFNKNGGILVVKTLKRGKIPALILKENLQIGKIDTVLKNFNDAKGITLDESGNQLAFVAERDSSKKESLKFYKLFYYNGGDSAIYLVDRNSPGMASQWQVSEFSNVQFSKSGKRIFFGTAPIIPLKDTTLPEFERVSVDVWNYKDEDLMTYQLHFNDTLLKKNYIAMLDLGSKNFIQLADQKMQSVQRTNEGDGSIFYGQSDFGRRIEKQWQGYTLEDIYTVDPINGNASVIAKNWKGRIYPSYTGKYLLLYNDIKKGYFVYNSISKKLSAVATDIKFPLFDEEADEPADPSSHGIVKWMEGDKYVLIYDKYDVWKVDPENREPSVAITSGRREKIEYRYEMVDPDEKFISPNQPLVFKTFTEANKNNGIYILDRLGGKSLINFTEASRVASISKAKDANNFIVVKESYKNSPNVFSFATGSETAIQLSNTNPQQANYNWGTSELYRWKAFTGKITDGILFKPEDFDPKKKYPMIVYFYDRSSATLNTYQPPAPTPSRLNIPFFVSRGYVVFVPDIWYNVGHPGKSAYNYIVSGARSLIQKGFIDSTKIGLQGQSWGGYQIAYLITQTNMFKAAWAGAPVVNMFSAYGGIRWESGVTRQSQYEKGQSRIGATVWEKPELYIENSPLFHLKNVKTPLVIMSNDADGAVPWYQGIEFFTAMRRLQKPVWLLDYNGEAHNLVERKNRKDIQIREQQYFDWLLKGATPPKWITDGVPSVMKGRDLGLGIN